MTICYYFFLCVVLYTSFIKADDAEDIRRSYIEQIDKMKATEDKWMSEVLTLLQMADTSLNETIQESNSTCQSLRALVQTGVAQAQDLMLKVSIANGFPIETQNCIINASATVLNSTITICDELMDSISSLAGIPDFDLPLRHNIFDILPKKIEESYSSNLAKFDNCVDQECLDIVLSNATWEYSALNLLLVNEREHLIQISPEFVFNIGSRTEPRFTELNNDLEVAYAGMKACCTCDCGCPYEGTR